MATETATPPPGPAPGPEITMDQLGSKGRRTAMPSKLVDAVNAEAGKNATTPPEQPAAPEPPKDTTPPVKTAPAANGKPPEPPKEAPKATPEPSKSKKDGIEEVRAALERSTKKADDLQNSLTATAAEKAAALQKQADLEAKYAEMSKKIQEDYEPRVKQLEVVQKRLQEREELIRIKDYTATEEFHGKYIKPLADAQAEANELLAECIIVNSDGTQRAATSDDFNEILAARSVNEAGNIATEKFGPIAGQTLVSLRQKIRSLERSRQEAIKNAGVESAEFEKRRQSELAQQRETTHNKLLQATQQFMQAEPDVFSPADDDPEIKNSLTEGHRLADLLLKGDPNLTQDQFLTKIAEGRTRIVKSYVRDAQVKKLTAENASLKEQLKAYQKSEPDVSGRNGNSALPAPSDARSKLLAAAQSLAAGNS